MPRHYFDCSCANILVLYSWIAFKLSLALKGTLLQVFSYRLATELSLIQIKNKDYFFVLQNLSSKSPTYNLRLKLFRTHSLETSSTMSSLIFVSDIILYIYKRKQIATMPFQQIEKNCEFFILCRSY